MRVDHRVFCGRFLVRPGRVNLISSGFFAEPAGTIWSGSGLGLAGAAGGGETIDMAALARELESVGWWLWTEEEERRPG